MPSPLGDACLPTRGHKTSSGGYTYAGIVHSTLDNPLGKDFNASKCQAVVHALLLVVPQVMAA